MTVLLLVITVIAAGSHSTLAVVRDLLDTRYRK